MEQENTQDAASILKAYLAEKSQDGLMRVNITRETRTILLSPEMPTHKARIHLRNLDDTLFKEKRVPWKLGKNADTYLGVSSSYGSLYIRTDKTFNRFETDHQYGT